MTRVTVCCCCCCCKKRKKRRKLRLVPGFGPVTEQVHSVAVHAAVKKIQAKTSALAGTKLAFTKEKLMATFTMSDSQQSVLSIQAVDRRGNPVALPTGSINWLTNSTDLLILQIAPDGSTCTVVAAGPLGTGTVTVKVLDAADNTLAAGSIDVTITAGAAQRIDVTAATPTEQP